MCGWMMNSLLNIQLIKIQTTFCSFSISIPAWTKLIFQNMNWIFSQRLFFKGLCSSFKVMDFRHAATQNSSELGKMFGQQDTFLAGVCEPKKKIECRTHIFSLSFECSMYQEITFWVSDFLVLPCDVHQLVRSCEPHTVFSQMLLLNIICADAAVFGLSFPMVLSYLVTNYAHHRQTCVIRH